MVMFCPVHSSAALFHRQHIEFLAKIITKTLPVQMHSISQMQQYQWFAYFNSVILSIQIRFGNGTSLDFRCENSLLHTLIYHFILSVLSAQSVISVTIVPRYYGFISTTSSNIICLQIYSAFASIAFIVYLFFKTDSKANSLVNLL